MTREEQISDTAQMCDLCGNRHDLDCFVAGAEWADSHPIVKKETMNHPKEIDWEQRKWELVCRIAQGMYAGRACHHALEAVQCAEDIITTYKERMSDSKKGGEG